MTKTECQFPEHTYRKSKEKHPKVSLRVLLMMNIESQYDNNSDFLHNN